MLYENYQKYKKSYIIVSTFSYTIFFAYYLILRDAGYKFPYGYFLNNPEQRFNDLYLQLNKFDLFNPYSSMLPSENFPYFPSSIIFFNLFKFVNPNYYSIVFIIFSLIVLFLVISSSFNKKNFKENIFIFFSILFSPPYIYALDRGNTDAFLIPILIYCILNNKNNFKNTFLWIFIASFKPQYLVGLLFKKNIYSKKIFEISSYFLIFNISYLYIFTNNDFNDLITSTLLVSDWVNIGLKTSIFPINDFLGIYLRNSSLYPLILMIFDFIHIDLNILSENYFVFALNIFKVVLNLIILFLILKFDKQNLKVVLFVISFLSITFWSGTYRSIIFALLIFYFISNNLSIRILNISLLYMFQFLFIGIYPFSFEFAIVFALYKFFLILGLLFSIQKEKMLN